MLGCATRFRDHAKTESRVLLGVTGADDGFLVADKHGMGFDIYNKQYPPERRAPLLTQWVLKPQPQHWSHSCAVLNGTQEQELARLTTKPMAQPIPRPREIGTFLAYTLEASQRSPRDRVTGSRRVAPRAVLRCSSSPGLTGQAVVLQVPARFPGARVVQWSP